MLFASVALLAAAIVLWIVSLQGIDLRRLTDVGLISVLPVTFLASFALVVDAFIVAITARRLHTLLLTILTGVLLLVLYGTPSVIAENPRTGSVWSLAGISEYIKENGSVDRTIDAFFNWPGFFTLQAFVSDISGVSMISVARWAPLYFNFLYLLPLMLIFRRLGMSQRHRWIAVWVFYLANWVSQDQLVPQAFAYFMYLVIIGMLLTSLTSAVMNPNGHIGLILIIVVLFAALAPSHQLTPWMTVFSVAALAIGGRAPFLGLATVMVVLAATWVVFFTGPYLSGHLGTVTGPIGSVATNVDTNLGERYEGSSAGHTAVLNVRVGLSLAVWALAFLGVYVMRRMAAPVRVIAVLALTPLLGLALQRYGGELLLRVYLFSLPFTALAAAAALVPLAQRPRVMRALGLSVVLFIFGVAFLTAKYGNEKMDVYTNKEVSAVRFLETNAPSGARILAAYGNGPLESERYADFNFEVLRGSFVVNGNVDRLAASMQRAASPSYVLLTRSQGTAGELMDGWPPGTLADFRRRLLQSHRFRIAFANEDAIILKVRERSPSVPRQIPGSAPESTPKRAAAA